MNADQKAWIERLDWIRNQLCRPSVTGLDVKLSTELLAKIDEQATQLATLAAENERLQQRLFVLPSEGEWQSLRAQLATQAVTIERQRAALLAIIKAETGTSQEESDAVAKMDAALAAAARELEGT